MAALNWEELSRKPLVWFNSGVIQEAKQLDAGRRVQLHAYGLGQPPEGKWRTTAQPHGEERRLWGPIKGRRQSQGWQDTGEKRTHFLKMKQWPSLVAGTESQTRIRSPDCSSTLPHCPRQSLFSLLSPHFLGSMCPSVKWGVSPRFVTPPPLESRMGE